MVVVTVVIMVKKSSVVTEPLNKSLAHFQEQEVDEGLNGGPCRVSNLSNWVVGRTKQHERNGGGKIVL